MHRTLAIAILVLAGVAGAAQGQTTRGSVRSLRIDRLLTIRIHITADQWRQMQPLRASRLAVAMAVPQHPTTQQALELAEPGPRKKSRPKPGTDRRPAGLVGNEYAWVSAAVEVDGQSYQRVGVRFKGQWSYALAGTSPRRPMKLQFDRYVRRQRFEGISSLSLSANAMDPSQMRESLAYAFFRDAGLPAPRTCFAMVYLTVDGMYQNELLGLYTALEEIDERFLREHFGTARGLLIRPERTRNLAYLGSRWEAYIRYNLQSDATPFTAGRFMDFTRLIQRADDASFRTQISGFFNGDEFLKFLAVNVMMINLDGVLVNGHNFYIYIHPKTGRLSFIPWDLHYSFGHSGSTMDEWVALSIDRPYRAGNRLVERIMSVEAMRNGYREHLRVFATGCFAPEKVHARMDQLEQVLRRAEAIAKNEGKVPPSTPATIAPRSRPELRPFVSGRVQSVLDQLAGRAEGIPIGGRPAPAKPAPVAKPAPPPPAIARPATRPAAATQPALAKTAPSTTRPAAKPQLAAAATRPVMIATTRPAASAAVRSATRPALAKAPPPTTRPARTAQLMGAATRPPTGSTEAPAVEAKPTNVAAPSPRPAQPVATRKPPLPPNPLAPVLLSTLDGDRDGQLSREEIGDAAKHLFIAHRWTDRGPMDVVSLARTFDHIGMILDPFPPSFDDAAPAEDPLRSRPALLWAGVTMRHTSATHEPRTTLRALLDTADRFFSEADANRDGLLNAREIGAYLDQLVPRQ